MSDEGQRPARRTKRKQKTSRPRQATNKIPPESRPRRSTRAEIRTRVDLVAEWLCAGIRKHEIKHRCRDAWSVGPRTVERLLLLARTSLLDAVGEKREVLIARSYGFLMSVLKDETAPHKDRVAACKEANSLLGLHAPKKIAPTTPEGESLPMPNVFAFQPQDLTDEELALLLRLKRKSARRDTPSKEVS